LTSDGTGPRASVVENVVTDLKAKEISNFRKTGTSGPIDAGGGGPQRARQASNIGFGREDAICENIEIICKSSSVRATKRGL
jgi:hypothetical protein